MARTKAPAPDLVWLGAALADVKDDVYRNTVALAALIEALVAKGVVSRDDVAQAARRLEDEAEAALRGAAAPER